MKKAPWWPDWLSPEEKLQLRLVPLERVPTFRGRRRQEKEKGAGVKDEEEEKDVDKKMREPGQAIEILLDKNKTDEDVADGGNDEAEEENENQEEVPEGGYAEPLEKLPMVKQKLFDANRWVGGVHQILIWVGPSRPARRVPTPKALMRRWRSQLRAAT